jgi:hypothetical protein
MLYQQFPWDCDKNSAKWKSETGIETRASIILYRTVPTETAVVVWWLEFLATDSDVQGSIPGASRFSERQRVWNGMHSASWRQLRIYLKEKVAAPV